MSPADSSSESTPNAPKAGERRRARVLALQALYQRELSRSPITDIEAEFIVDNDMSKVDSAFFRDLLRGVDRYQETLDRHFEPFLDRPLAEVDPIERSILRLSTYEFAYRIDVPYRVVINESIELAKRFGGTEGHKYVNSVLDKLARRLRGPETSHRR
jgi:N utilization substance protein B